VTERDTDVVVAGGGLAGLTAALFAVRYGRSTVVLTGGVPGGPLLSVARIDDFPGFPQGVAGYELCPLVQEQAAAAGAMFRMGELAGLEEADGGWRLSCTDGELLAGAVIVATGSMPRRLGVGGEERLTGRGVSHCASCDGPLHRGRVVGVVGGGDSALQEALELAGHVERVIVFHRGTSFSAQAAYQQRLRETPNITVRLCTAVEELLGEQALEAVRVRDLESGETESVPLAGLFPYVGTEARTSFLGGLLPLDGEGRIPTDTWMRTERPGLLAAGDVRADSAAQAVTVAGDGATAAISAHRYLEDGSWAPGPAGAARADGRVAGPAASTVPSGPV
jgi:thioredoxin reductase (NADPH)